MKNENNINIFQILNYLVFTVFGIICTYPFYYIFICSLSLPQELYKNGVFLLPAGFTLSNYLVIFKLQGLTQAFFISTLRAVIGTIVTIFFCSMFGYVLTKKELFGRKLMYRITVISMYLSAGLIPWYITMLSLGLKNSFLLYILPFAVQPFILILIKTYIEQIPYALEESALIDGASYFRILISIIFPIIVPIVAAVAVFSAVGQWNSWQDNFFLVNDSKLNTLQLTLLNYLRQAEAITNAQNKDLTLAKNMKMTPMAIRMTITMVVTIPVILIYPFLQKYFIKGIMLGAVKG